MSESVERERLEPTPALGEDAALVHPIICSTYRFYVTVGVLLGVTLLGVFAYWCQYRQGLGVTGLNQFATTQPYAGLPSKQVCFGCHEPQPAGAAGDESLLKFASLMAFAETDGDIPWHRVTASRQDVFFSHRRHVTVGKIDCARCHPDVPGRTSPPTRGPIEMSMDACIRCHEEAKSSVDCVSCHR